MGFRRYLKVVFLVLLPFTAFCEIVTASSFLELGSEVEALGSQDLIVLDIDCTLLQPSEPELRWDLTYDMACIRELTQAWSGAKWRCFFNLVVLTRDVEAMEEEAIQIFRRAGERGVKIIALTNALTDGLQGIVDSTPELRHKQLVDLGLDLKLSSPISGSFVFEELDAYLGGKPEFYEGVICANGPAQAKAEVLEAFIARMGWTPRRVFFADDKLKFVQGVDEKLVSLGIESIAVHYTRMWKQERPDPMPSEEQVLESWQDLVHLADFLLEIKSADVESPALN